MTHTEKTTEQMTELETQNIHTQKTAARMRKALGLPTDTDILTIHRIPGSYGRTYAYELHLNDEVICTHDTYRQARMSRDSFKKARQMTRQNMAEAAAQAAAQAAEGTTTQGTMTTQHITENGTVTTTGVPYTVTKRPLADSDYVEMPTDPRGKAKTDAAQTPSQTRQNRLDQIREKAGADTLQTLRDLAGVNGINDLTLLTVRNEYGILSVIATKYDRHVDLTKRLTKALDAITLDSLLDIIEVAGINQNCLNIYNLDSITGRMTIVHYEQI